MNKCIFCEEELQNAFEGAVFQPYEGGEVQFIFSFGSTKFDRCFGDTVFRGLICDNCAEKFVDKMKEEHRNI